MPCRRGLQRKWLCSVLKEVMGPQDRQPEGLSCVQGLGDRPPPQVPGDGPKLPQIGF